jgi:pyrophosphatase PpaX
MMPSRIPLQGGEAAEPPGSSAGALGPGLGHHHVHRHHEHVRADHGFLVSPPCLIEALCGLAFIALRRRADSVGTLPQTARADHAPGRCGCGHASIGAVHQPHDDILTRSPALSTDAERIAGASAVLFDLDGTLIDTVELIRVSFEHATRTVLGEAIPDEITMAGVGQPLLRQFREMAPGHEDELLRVYREFNMAHHDDFARAYPGTREVLEDLRARGVRMGVVTSKGTAAATLGLATFGLADFFEVVVTADDVSVHKPDPHPLRHAADAMGVELRYCVYLGDSPHDMQAALGGGAVPVAALWGAFTADEVLVPGVRLALGSIADLPALLFGDARRFAV